MWSIKIVRGEILISAWNFYFMTFCCKESRLTLDSWNRISSCKPEKPVNVCSYGQNGVSTQCVKRWSGEIFMTFHREVMGRSSSGHLIKSFQYQLSLRNLAYKEMFYSKSSSRQREASIWSFLGDRNFIESFIFSVVRNLHGACGFLVNIHC